MSSPKQNLPMLIPYLLGDEMSSHDGVSCYPAIHRDTEEKYIVKVISVPASQAKLDALLLAGAMSSREEALDYFKTMAEDVIHQTDILRSLSQQEGFVPYLDGQIIEKEDGTGFEVTLLGTYRNSLARVLRSDPLTHAEVTGLALDLCAALAACRRAGYLYLDLKPSNIFRDPDHGFRIGDVGFVALQSLAYASLPDKYRSRYTAPELLDDMAVLNTTADIYALGLVLYQAYNGGVLPLPGDDPSDPLPPPAYADYEMAAILAKACHPDPKERWQEPNQMAHAIIEYMQTYGAPETPLVPPVIEQPEEADEPFLPEATPEQLEKELAALENAEPEELAFLTELVSDETAPSEENAAAVSAAVVTEELTEILAQADELICHDLPEPPVVPEPVFVPMPVPIDLDAGEADAAEPAPEPLPEAEAATEPTPAPQPETDGPQEPENSLPPYMDPEALPLPERPLLPRILAAAAVVLVLLLGWFFGQKHYNDYYLATVNRLVLESQRDMVTVHIYSDIDEQLLSVVCTDTYGNSATSSVTDGIATFTGLSPNTRYIIRVEISGWHKLLGDIADSFTTPAQTQIHSFTATIGPEDGSVQLNFAVSGPETDSWTLVYSAEGIPERTMHFTGRSPVVTGLQPGALYTFTLISTEGLYMAGQTQVQFLATNILLAQDLTITACGEGSLSVQWAQPADDTVALWHVRCFNEAGYNVTITTSDLSYTFTDLDHSTPCTIEVTADGMNQSVSTSITAYPVRVDSFSCGLAADNYLQVAWEYSGPAPAGGWILRYQIGDGEALALPLAEPSAKILAIPGAEYHFTVETAGGNYVFDSTYSCPALDIPLFSAGGVTAAELQWLLFVWPEETEETDIFAALAGGNVVTEYTVGDQTGFAISYVTEPEKSERAKVVQFMLHDGNGLLLDQFITEPDWSSYWQEGCCLLPVPVMPDAEGEYILTVYFDGCFVHRQDFTVLEPEVVDPPEDSGTQPPEEEPLAN